MDSSSSTPKEGDGGESASTSPIPENLTPEKLMTKCRTLLNIAQKAKLARDDALKENVSLQEKFNKLSKQYDTSQEMLATLTEQKLHFAMQLDDFKKERTRHIEEIQNINSLKVKFEAEAESFRRQYDREAKENEHLSQALEAAEKKISSDKNITALLEADVKKLHENNENMKQLWSTLSQEKRDLEEKLDATFNRVLQLQNQHKQCMSYFTSNYGITEADFDERIKELCKSPKAKLPATEATSDDMNELKTALETATSNLSVALSEKENSESELAQVTQRLNQTLALLEEANSDREKVEKNLEDVRIETRTLIENSEKVSEELENVKKEKVILDEKFNQLEEQLKSKELLITQLSGQVKDLEQEKVDTLNEIEGYKETINDLKLMKNENAVLCEEIKRLKTQISELSTESSETLQWAEENANLKSHIANLEKIIDTMNENNAKLNNDKIDSLNNFCSLKKTYEELSEEQHRLVEQLEEFKAQKIILDSELTKSKAELTKYQTIIKQNNEVIQTFEQQIEKQQNESKQDKELVNDYKKENDDLYKKISKLDNEIIRLRDEMDQQKEIHEQYITKLKYDFEENVQGKTDQIEELNLSKNKLQSNLEEIEQQCKKWKEECHKYANLSGKLQETEIVVKSLEKENEEYKSLNQEYKERLDQFGEEKKSIYAKLEALHIQLTNLNSDFEKKEANYKNTISKLKKEYAESIKVKETEITKLLSQQGDTKEQTERVAAQLNQLNNKIEEKNEEIISLQQRIEDLLTTEEKHLTELSTFKETTDELKLAKEQLNSELQKFANEKVDSHKQFSEEIATLKQRETELNKSISELQTELAANQQSNTELLNSNSVLTKEVAELKKLIQETTDENKNYASAIKELKQENSKLVEIKNKLKLSQEKVTKLENELSTSSSSLSSVKTELSKNIEQLQLQLDEYKTQSEATDNLKNLIDEKEVCIKELSSKLDNSLKELNSSQLLASTQNEEISKLTQELTQIKSQVDLLTKSEQELKTTVNHSHDLSNQIAELNSTKVTLKETIDAQSNQIMCQNQTIAQLKCQISELTNQIQDYLKIIDDLKEKNVSLNKKASETFIKEQARLNDEITNLVTQLNNLQEELVIKNTELKENNRVWLARLVTLNGEVVALKQTEDDLKGNINQFSEYCASDFVSLFSQVEKTVTTYVEEHIASNKRDLLLEMQHMNQAIKERGELISKLQESLAGSKNNLASMTDLNSNLKAEVESLAASLDEKVKLLSVKEMTIKELDSELQKLRGAHDTSTDADGLSTSTYSRAEEGSRLNDIEESFEEKYIKLRTIAVKLKKRHADTTQLFESERTKWNEEKAELLEKIQHLSSLAKNAQKLQESFDKLMDDLEDEKKNSKQLKVKLEESDKTEEQLKARIDSLENEGKKIPGMKKLIETIETNLKSAKKDNELLKKEKEVEVMKFEELKKEKQVLDNKFADLKNSLDQAVQQGRTNSVLELEIQNYEKTISDLSAQLNNEKEIVKKLKQETEVFESVRNGLEEQIKLLESQVHVEEERNLNFNEEISTSRSKLEELQNQIEQQLSKIHELSLQLHAEQSKNETLVMETTSLTATFSKKEKELMLQVDKLQNMVHGLESSLAFSKQDLDTANNEMTRLKIEFDNYKVRAQSVLAKQKGDFIAQSEKEAREQLDIANNDIKALKQKLESCLSDLDAVKSENLVFVAEKERSDKRIEDLTKIIQQKSSEYDELHAEYRTQKISIQTLKQCYKKEIEELKKSQKEEINNLQIKIDELSVELSELKVQGINDKTEGFIQEVSAPEVMSCSIDSLPKEREDGEGSESVPSPKTRRKSGLIPLDVLLNSPMSIDFNETALSEQLDKLRSELLTYEIRNKHLTSLLSEAERETARNLQMNTLLKEEIRRLERSLERQPHVTNTEYLKNIIFKFLTLNGGDERSRLVPVLDTILKLSPDEHHKLAAVAKGESGTWMNYLPTWSSSSKD